MKIFLTVGSMLPFDRLIRAMDVWAKEHPDTQVFAQIGKTRLCPANMEYRTMISPSEYRTHFAACDLVVSHAGMGTVITSLECRKPLVVLPRRQDLHEVTSNHQLATAKWLEDKSGICVIYSENELAQAISESAGADGVSIIETGTRGKLIDALRQFVSS